MRRWHLSAFCALVALLATDAACWGGTPTDPGGCSEPITATVSGGLMPDFAWTPACEIGGVSVVEVLFDTTCQCYLPHQVWAVETADPDHNTLRPPIHYSQLPKGARTVQAPEVLVAGKEYEASLLVRFVERLSSGVYQKGDSVLVRLRFSP